MGLSGLQQPPTDGGLSLEQLNEAFAEMLGGGSDPYTAVPAPVGIDDTLIDPGPVTEPDSVAEGEHDEACEITPRSIFEAMLFVGHPQNEPLTSTKVASLMRGVRAAEIDDLVRELNEMYVGEGRPYEIVSVGEGYRLALRDKFEPVRNLFYGRVRQHRLSPAALEVLSVVAYHGAIAADEVTRLRGAPSGAVLSQLVRRQLLSVEKTDTKPRQLIFRPTKRFLELFGLVSLDDLPRSSDIDKR